MIVICFILLLIYDVSAEPPSANESSYPYDMPEELWLLYEQSSDLMMEEKIIVFSQTMMGLPYVLNGIGEGVPPDSDPMFRFDNYDCLSFVETILALSMSKQTEDIEIIVKDLRYHGDITYTNRNHFMISQWIPNAIEKGYLKDITKELGEVHITTKSITTKNWSRWRGRHAFHLTNEEYPTGDYLLETLTLDTARQVMDDIPTGSIIIVVRENRDYNPIWITHLGFVVRETVHQKTYTKIRHATIMGNIVKENHLRWYLNYLLQFDKWPIEGILVLEPQIPPQLQNEIKQDITTPLELPM